MDDLNIGISPLRLSVITPVRNAEATIDRLFQSLALQRYAHFEWIVIDALSTDSTREHMAGYAIENEWIRFISEDDFGLYHAINKGIQMAKGDYYIVAGADDIFTPEALSNYASIAQTSGADVVLAYVMRAGRRIGGFRPAKAWLGHPKVFLGSHSIGMLIRRGLHREFGLYSNRFPLLADGYFLKQLLRSRRVEFVNANFMAGEFMEGGATTVNQIQILAETWQIQMLTERAPFLQICLAFAKTVFRYPAIRRELLKRQLTGRSIKDS